MKTLKSILAAVALLIANCQLPTANCFAQCLPMIKIDGSNIIADENHPAGMKLPSWLRNPQTLERGQYVFSISVIEFTVNGTALDYSQNLSITTPAVTVPAGKVWKIESIHKDAAMSQGVTTLYSTAGAFTFIPSCSGTYKVKVWGGGGSGGGGNSCQGCATGGGGGGGYSEGEYFLTAGSSYTGTVGAGGAGRCNSCGNGLAGGNSVFNGPSVLTATGGAGGFGVWCGGCGQVGGAGGTASGGQLNYTGQAGAAGSGCNGGKGGDAPSGGAGGFSEAAGIVPGGGSGGAGCSSYVSQAGAVGRVEISSGSSGSVTLTPKVPCVTLYQYSSSSCSATNPAPCPSGWSDAGCGASFYGGAWTYVRTCYRCD